MIEDCSLFGTEITPPEDPFEVARQSEKLFQWTPEALEIKRKMDDEVSENLFCQDCGNKSEVF